ncbi:MAG: dockerin type I domain-containing protein [Dehalococcoidia bacterium]|nr:dockerin type I domain-containing protein [Dehalococcoidia bacterium]
MKSRLLLAATVAVAMTLALAGILRDVSPTRALMPDPLQPFGPNEKGGLSSTALGVAPGALTNYTITEVIRGERLTLPWIYTPPGFQLQVDKELEDGFVLGSVTADLDALCNSSSPADADVLATAASQPPNFIPYTWYERTTKVEGTSEEYLKALIPPFSWLLRHRADLDTIWLGGINPLPITTPLNTVYTNVPISPNGAGFIATTTNVAGATAMSTSSAVCLDSPQNSVSLTTMYGTPPNAGDNSGVIVGSDASIVGLWTDNTVVAPKTVTVVKVKANNGLAGNFIEHWEAEVTAPNITATWVDSGTSVLDQAVAVPSGPSAPATENLSISCAAGAAEGLVVIKNVLWPVAPTVETYPENNAATFVVRVICSGDGAATLVDKEVIWIKANPDPIVATVLGPPIPVMIDELKANHEPSNVLGNEWLVAEVAPGALEVAWSPGVMVDQGEGSTPVIVPTTSCAAGDACITFQVDEPWGQSDVHAQLNVGCLVPGLQSVVIKAIDAPAAPLGESKPADNAQRAVIKVWCGASPVSPDGIDDNTGLYPRWTAFRSNPDDRMPFAIPPDSRGDTRFGERTIDLQCYWIDGNGATDDNGNGYIEPGTWDETGTWLPGESMDDMPAGADDDHDCLIDPAFAQPGRPVDLDDSPNGVSCPPVPYSGVPNVVVYDTAADMDCDGLLDGIEMAWGSNPYAADSDGDGANDFEEMFNFTNPLNPDTDGDGLLDKPEDDYAAAPAGGAANSVPEARVAGNCADGIDNDTDGRTDAADPGCDATDSDGDGASDADERALDSNPYNAASKPEAWIAGTCADGIDNDLDGKKDNTPPADPGCKATDTDGDGKTDVDEVGLGSIYLNEAGEAADSDDNCPLVYNPDQANNEGRGRPNGPFLAGGVSSNPVADIQGDACDTDDDNDRVLDGAEPLSAPAPTDPYNADTDGDRCLDGAELLLGSIPTDPSSKCPATLSPAQQAYFRACHWNLPPNGYDGGIWDAEYDGIDDDTELDPDGDGILCPRVSTPPPGSGDKDADNAASAYGNLTEVEDTVEIKGYNTFASQANSDGDECVSGTAPWSCAQGCEDWIEIADVNGDRVASPLDRTAVLQRVNNLIPADPVSDAIFDVNKDGVLTALDGTFVGLNSSATKSPASCLPLTSDLHRSLP